MLVLIRKNKNKRKGLEREKGEERRENKREVKEREKRDKQNRHSD